MTAKYWSFYCPGPQPIFSVFTIKGQATGENKHGTCLHKGVRSIEENVLAVNCASN